MERLKKLSDKNILELMKSIENKDYEDSVHAYCYLKQLIEWKTKSPDLEYAVYSPEGDYSDSTFILQLIVNGGIFTTYFSSTDAGCLRLKDALNTTKIFSPEGYCVLSTIPERVQKIIGTEWRRKIAGPEQLIQDCHCYVLPKEKALKLSLECPEGVYLRDLTLEDAELIDSQWPHRNAVSLSLIKAIISTSTCLGLCSKENGELLSWALKWYYGGIGVVQTLKHAKRRGYAQVVCSALAKKMAADNWPIHLVIIDGHPESIPLFTKMGFVKLFKNNWMYYHVFDKK